MKINSINKAIAGWKKLTSGSVNRKIFGAAVTVGLFTVFVKLVAVSKELLIAQKFGIGDELDAFLIALLIPSFIINVVANSFSAALIPVYIKVREREGRKAAQRLFSEVIFGGLGLLIIITVLMLVTAPLYLPSIAAGFDAEKLNLTFNLLYAIAPFIILSGIQNICSAILNAGERFILAAFTPIITPGITMILLLWVDYWQTFTLAIGLICGTAIEIIVLAIAMKRQKISFQIQWCGFSPHLRQVSYQFLPIVVSSFLMCSTNVVDQSMAAMLSKGSVAALNYGNRVIALPITLATTALSTAVIPYFSKMVASEDWKNVRRTLKYYLQLIFLATIPLTGIFIACSEIIVRFLFQRGSFTASDTELVAQIQSYFALQIPFYIGVILVVRLLSSMQLNQILMWGSAISLIVNIVANYYFMDWFGVKGIALSTSCVLFVSFLYLLFWAIKCLNLKKKYVS